VLTEYALSDQDISSLINSGEIFLEEGRYRLNIEFDSDPQSREGIVFRESRLIARALGLKPVTPGVFLDLDSEQLQYVLTNYGDGIGMGIYSSLTGEKVDSFNLIPQGRWSIDEIMQGFIGETEEFIESYFGNEERPESRIVDYKETLEETRALLKRIKKGLPPLR
jgi:hypothetical protein